MLPPNTPYSATLAAAGLICLVVAVLVWQHRRHAAGASALILLMVALSWWDLTYAVFWAGVPGPTPYFWLDFTYIGVVIVPAAFFAFALQIARLDRFLRRPLVIALTIEPLLILLLLWSDPWHDLFFGGKRTHNAAMILDAGPAFWANVIYSNILILIGTLILIRAFRQADGLYRKQLGLVLGAACIPWFNSLIFQSGLNPLPNADNTPFSFTIAALLFAFALLHYRLLDLAPIARDVLIDNMSDGVLVLDAHNRVVDLNPAARRILGNPSIAPIGAPVGTVFSAWPDVVRMFHDVRETHTVLPLGAPPQRFFDLRISPLYDRRHQFLGRLIVWRDITELKRVQHELQQLATTDELTQVYNRRFFLETTRDELKRATRFRHSFALALLDIDHFKRINDQYGHAVGDEVLVAIARLCQAQLREVDVFARFGGEEWALLLPETDVDQAFEVVERLRRGVARTPIAVAGLTLPITVSAGLTTWQGHQDTIELMLSRADQALYAAKAAGRNCTVIWQPGIPTASKVRTESNSLS